MTTLPVVALILLAGPVALAAYNSNQPGSAPTPKPEAAAPAAPAPQPVKATIGDLGYLHGTWRADMRGQMAEEIWSAPSGNNIMGCFRWQKPDGSAMLLELLAITQEADAVRLRLRHHTAALGAKEPADKPQTLVLTGLEGTRATFSAERDAGGLSTIRYAREGDRLTITVSFSNAGRAPLVFEMSKASGG